MLKRQYLGWVLYGYGFYSTYTYLVSAPVSGDPVVAAVGAVGAVCVVCIGAVGSFWSFMCMCIGTCAEAGTYTGASADIDACVVCVVCVVCGGAEAGIGTGRCM
jgi:hypothetical protein